MNWNQIFSLVGISTLETLQMVFFSTIFSVILGLPLGVLMCVTDSQTGIIPHPILNKILNRIVDVLRSFPFLILMIILFPLSRILIGTTIGTKATIVPLAIAAAPFVARIVETSLKGLDSGLILAAKSMGSTSWQIITKVMIPECLPSLIDGLTLTIINLIGYSAMAGTIGGGVLGDLAIRYGYQRYRLDVLVVSVIVILILVGLIQMAGTMISKSLLKRR